MVRLRAEGVDLAGQFSVAAVKGVGVKNGSWTCGEQVKVRTLGACALVLAL
jgi:hypothetical protein